MKREAINHTKMKRLCRSLDLPLYQAVGILELMWHTTARQTPRGDIGRLTDDDIALSIDYRNASAELIHAIVEAGWIDRNDEYRLVVHDWPDHAEEGVHMKLARAKQFFVIGDSKDPQKTFLTPPKLWNLPPRDKAVAEDFYRGHGVATHTPHITHGVATNSLFVATDGTFITTPWPRRAPGVAGPRLDPALTPPIKTEYSTTATSAPPLPPSSMQFGEWPKTAEAICTPYPSADAVLVGKIIQASVQAFVSVKNRKTTDIDDSLLAEAVIAAAKESNGQTSAALFLKTVPTVVSNWAKHGRNGTAGPPKRTAAQIDPSKIGEYDPFKLKKGAPE